ncbi:MAG: RNA polymerase sigma factor [Bradymonadales bacterium]|nr:RNA polymerase sigma factor [Bradymonadales bacterium]
MTPPRCQADDLRQRALQGDPHLLEDLFHCYRADLLSFLRQRCQEHADAEDAIQDAFLAAARYLQHYRGEAQIKTWLYHLASSACTRMRRGQKNNPALHQELDEMALTKGEDAADKVELVVDTRLRPLKRAIEQLKPVDRQVLLLRDGQGMSTREVACALHLTESAVKSRLHRIRRAVKEVLSLPALP